MNFWNYIGELLLFRWLYGKLTKSTTEHRGHTESPCTSIDKDYLGRNHNDHIAPTDVRNNLIDEDDNSDDLDDMDIFMRNSRHTRYNNYDQSFNDFHEEQDNYDMLDDF